MKFSIVIPAFNAERTIAQTVRAALSQDCQEPFEVIVVDDGSKDNTARIVRSFPEVVYVHQANAGPASARNSGVRQARGEFIFFTDSDCIPHPDWARRILPHFVDVDVAAVAGSYGIANPSSPLAFCVHAEIRYRHRKLMPSHPRVFGSYNVAIRRHVIGSAGGFLEAYCQASGEDNDLSYKIIRSGAKIYFEPDALVDHYHPVRVKKYLGEQFRHGFWRARMYRNHPGMLKGDDYTFWKDAFEVPLAVGVFFGGLVLMAYGWTFFASGCSDWTLEKRLFGHFFSALVVGTFPAVLLAALELFFSWRILGRSRLVLFWSAIMFLRSIFRTAGFAAGGVNSLTAGPQN